MKISSTWVFSKADRMKLRKMKGKVGNEYLRTTRKILETKLYGSYLIKGLNEPWEEEDSLVLWIALKPQTGDLKITRIRVRKD